jgi:hypothetical protein
MRPLILSLSEHRALKKQIRDTKDVKVLKRAQAFLWLSELTFRTPLEAIDVFSQEHF